MTQIVCFHSGDQSILEPRRFLHVGTLDQARMRGGRQLHRLSIDPGIRIPRLRDHGSWNVRVLQRHTRRARIAAYLNRHEGIPIEEFEEARRRWDIDALADGAFRRAIPSAADSWIVLDPAAITLIEAIDWP